MPSEIKSRSELNPADQWNLGALYASPDAWESEMIAAQNLGESIVRYAGHLADSPEALAQALTDWFAAIRQVEKLYVYAHLVHDQDLGNAVGQTKFDRAQSFFIQLDAAGSFIAPEILAIEEETVRGWLVNPSLVPYRFWLEDLLRGKPHTLSASEERLLSMVSEPLAALHQVYSVLKNVDITARLPRVAGESGEPEQLSHAAFIRMQESHDRSLRKAAFEAYYVEWQGNCQTALAALDGAIKANIFEAQARNFDNALASALFPDNVSSAVYDALIEAVHGALPAFYDYVALRKRLLGLDEMHMYDNYVPVVSEVSAEYTYDEAVEIICEALAPLGEDYVRIAREGMTTGWVDRYENKGKRSGAYSSGCYDSLPYILMNFTGTLDSVFTLAHELGHSMHSYLSNANQPYHLADYRILVAEVASTTNESLLTHYLLNKETDLRRRAYLVDRYLDSFRATLFRQTMFAEFEKMLYEMIEGGEPLTVDALNERYLALVKLYFGDSVAFDEEDKPISWEWARVDHFFYDFYVYKYATGMASAVDIAQRILDKEPGALENYMVFLSGGGSDYPLNLLKGAGVDLETPEPVANALREFGQFVQELDRLLS